MYKDGNKVIVIGGGAAGMMAAVICSQNGADVTLLEQNEKLGRKLNITGKGRCNLTNNCSAENVLANIPCNSRFLYSALTRFDPQAVMAFFEDNGLKLKTERGSRVFPLSDSAHDVTDTLRRLLKKNRVRILHERAEALRLSEDGAVCGVDASRFFAADAVILATGGVSYPATGSTGDGYRMAKEVGHTIITPKPSLISLCCEGGDCAAMQGLSLRNVALYVTNRKKKKLYEDFGEMLFTDKGVTGPMILSASAHLRRFDREQYILHIDLKPALTDQMLDARLVRELTEYHNRDIANIMTRLLPRSMIPVILRRADIEPTEKGNCITRAQRRSLLETMKHLTFTVTGPGPIEQAIITSGGVKTGEIDPKTMGSKKVRGLYFAGEIIDADAYTGGFNLQIAWSTAYAAGMAAASQNKAEERNV